MEYAAQQKMIVLGSAHTLHLPGRARRRETIPSIGDMESREVPDLICGIVNVVEGPDGTKKCGDIASCGPPSNCDVTVAVNATADVQNAMVLGFCPCASWCRRRALGDSVPRGGCRGYPGGRGGRCSRCWRRDGLWHRRSG
jgi:hypothetical protein